MEDLPDIIDPSVLLQDPNEPIQIHNGEFILRQNETDIAICGKISFVWFPEIAVIFSGEILNNARAIRAMTTGNSHEVVVNGSVLGSAFLLQILEAGSVNVRGKFLGDVIAGDKSVAVSSVSFGIPNLRFFHGDSVKRVIGSRYSLCNARLTFENEKYSIIIDKVDEYHDKARALRAQGGFDILYGGIIEKKNGAILHSELKELTKSFHYFLSFLNGRRCCPIIFKGLHDGETIWTDYSGYVSESIKTVQSWPPHVSIEGLNALWAKWSELSKDELDFDFLITLVHWYIEANSKVAMVEGSIILAQTALELIYNWLVVEKKGILVGNDASNISAANKIRILLTQLNVDFKIPATLEKLNKYQNSFSDSAVDAPECFVRIRNAIVHGNEDKRRMLAKVENMARYEALQLGLWYIELAILKILDYKGVYTNRTIYSEWIGTNEQNVPWTSSSS